MVRPVVWRPPAEPSPAEQAVIKAVRRAKLFVFLRLHRHELFDEQFQAELAAAYADRPKGQPPVPPAQLALATILQAYTGVSDDEVIEATVMDRRWQLVLDCMGAEEPPFSKGTLVGFRKRLIERNLDRRLVERTVELAAATGGFGARALRAALDSSPLWGAGRVEDTFNLMGHALRKALGVIAVLQGRGQAAGTAVVAAQAGVPQLAASSLKAALDADWDDPAARDQALAEVLGLLDQVEAFIAGQAGDQAAAAAVAVARQIRDQDVDLTGPAPALRRGVAKDRRISVEDSQMRHGRKSRSVLFDGYKRHVLRDLDTGLVPAVGITPANAPEASVTDAIAADLDAAGLAPVRAAHRPGLPVLGAGPRPRPGPGDLLQGLAGAQHRRPVRQGPVHSRLRRRAADLPRRGEPCRSSPARPSASPRTPAPHARCGHGAPPAATDAAYPSTPTRRCWPSCAAASRPPKDAPSCANAPRSSTPSPTSGTGKAAAPATAAPARTCSTCAASPSSTTSTSSMLSIHPGEALLAGLRRRQQTPEGRAKLRNTPRSNTPSPHIGYWQGRRARYRGTRKNLFDLRRVAVVHNLHIIARQPVTDSYQLAA